MTVLLDTNFYLSLVHPADKYANRGVEILRDLSSGKYGLLFTSNLVISEVTTLAVVRTKGNQSTLQHLASLVWGENKLANILDITRELEKETWDLFCKLNRSVSQKKKIFSFVDATLITLGQNHRIKAIVSFDPHFDQFFNRLS